MSKDASDHASHIEEQASQASANSWHITGTSSLTYGGVIAALH